MKKLAIGLLLAAFSLPFAFAGQSQPSQTEQTQPTTKTTKKKKHKKKKTQKEGEKPAESPK